jgi:sulfate permease, SulP family
MFFVVAFSSSLDVAAIEMELGLPLDYNRELNTVGISNLISGLCGGYTGSYIFTQTTFNMRRGVDRRLCGYIICIGELFVALLPISIISYIPKLFFGSLLILIATELLIEWLVCNNNHYNTNTPMNTIEDILIFLIFV